MGTLIAGGFDGTAMLSLTGLRDVVGDLQKRIPSCGGGASWGALVDFPLKASGRHGHQYTTLSDFEDKVELHKGRHSTVWSARCRRSGRIVVVKAYLRHKLKPRQLLNVQREITLLRLFSQAGCPGVVKLLAHFDDADAMCLVCEACMRGDLYQSLLKSKGGLSESYVCAKVVVPLLSILNQTHKLSIVHRDIKPENIFITQAGEIQLGDFGLAVHKQQDNLTERVGTLDYMAPEVLAMPTPDEMALNGKKAAKTPYDEKVDIWAVGILVYELLVGRPPFEVEDAKETARLILGARVPIWPSSLSPLAADFIRAALSKAPADRPAATELLGHAWVRAHVRERDMPGRPAQTLKEMLEASSRGSSQHNLDMDGGSIDPWALAKATSPRKALSAGDDPFLMDQDAMPYPNLHIRSGDGGGRADVAAPRPLHNAAASAAAAALLGGALAKLRLLEGEEPLKMAQRSHSSAGMARPPAKSVGGAPQSGPLLHRAPLSSGGGGGGVHLQMFDYGANGRRASSGTSEFLIDSPRRESSPLSMSDDGCAAGGSSSGLPTPAAAGGAASAGAGGTLASGQHLAGHTSSLQVEARAESVASLAALCGAERGSFSFDPVSDGGTTPHLPPACCDAAGASSLPAYRGSFLAKGKTAAKSRFG